jgi:hypothetical protein
MRSFRLLLAPLAVALPLAAGCGHDAASVPRSAIAVVGDRTIARSQFDLLMAQSRQSYSARGRAFPATGTPAYAHLKVIAVRLLVEQAELEQKAPKLGVRIDSAQVENARRRLIEDSFGGSREQYRARLLEARLSDAQVRAALRAQLLSAAVFQAVTADVTVGAQAVLRYYESHLAEYATPSTRTHRGRVKPLATVRAAIERKLLAEKRSRVFAAWLAGVRREFARKTRYAEGFRPESSG